MRLFFPSASWQFWSIDPLMDRGYISADSTQRGSSGGDNRSSSDSCGINSSSGNGGGSNGTSNGSSSDDHHHHHHHHDNRLAVLTHARIHCARCLSQDFVISPYDTTSSFSPSPSSSSSSSSPSTISIVIACHSHAPLQEFWDRLVAVASSAPSTPTSNTPSSQHHTQHHIHHHDCYCISLPCCGKNWSTLTTNEPPIKTYDDYEILSPKRKIFIYSNK